MAIVKRNNKLSFFPVYFCFYQPDLSEYLSTSLQYTNISQIMARLSIF